MDNLERISRKYLMECLIMDAADQLLESEADVLEKEYVYDFCTIRFDMQPDRLIAVMEGEFNGFYEFERDSVEENDIE